MDLRKGGLRVLGAVAALWLGAPLFMPGCSTGAVGIDACRAIESARCDAAPDCQNDDASFGIETEDQIRNCKVFYNDHCLVGLENTSAEPAQDDVDACTAAIAETAKCKRNADIMFMEDCNLANENKAEVLEGQAGLTPCEVLQEPENLKACNFVAAPEDPEE